MLIYKYFYANIVWAFIVYILCGFFRINSFNPKKRISCLKYDQILLRKVTCYLNKITLKIKAETTKLPTVGTHRGNELLRRKVNLLIFIMGLDLIIYWCFVQFVNMAYGCSCNTLKIASNSFVIDTKSGLEQLDVQASFFCLAIDQ